MSKEKPDESRDLRLLKSKYSPHVNPLLEPTTVSVKRVRVRAGVEQPLANTVTGEIVGASCVHTIQDKDDAEFVKVFSAGIAAAYDLSRTGQRVFQAVLQAYERSPMTGGFADSVYLAWFDGGLSGHSIGMSEKTFNRGFRELLEKEFLAPRAPNTFWVNPALFFKGSRVLFVKEYRRVRQGEPIEQGADQAKLPDPQTASS